MNTTSTGRTSKADSAITVLLAVLFAAAWLASRAWPFQTALFPRVAAITGLFFCLVRLGIVAVNAARGQHTRGTAPAEAVDDDPSSQFSAEYVFETAGARTWSICLAWIAGFFALTFVAGVFVSAPLFALVYLRVAGHVRWWVAVPYAVTLWAFLYGTFVLFLQVPVPDGLFG